MWLIFESTRKAVPNSWLLARLLNIARKGLWGQFILVFPELINRNTKISWSVTLYSDRIFQVANRKSFLRLLLVFIMSHFFVFFFRNECFSVDGELAHRTTSGRRRAMYWWTPFRHPVIPLQSAAPLGSDVVCSRSSGGQTLLFPSPSLAARICDPPTGWLPLHEEAEGRSLMCRGYMLHLLYHVTLRDI
jgi:hypothetical protein